MKGKISKSYKFATIITCKDLQTLNDFIASEYKFLKYEMITIDGAEYEIEKFDEILNYGNPKYRKIVEIIIYATNVENKYTYLYDFEICLKDLAKNMNSITYTIRNVSDNQIVYITERLKELTHNFKAPYSWIYNKWVLIIFIFIIYIALSIPLSIFFKDKISEVLIFLYQISFGVFISSIAYWAFRKITSHFFPETIFSIGKQTVLYEKIKSIRYTILYIIIIGFIISLLSSLSVYIITK